MDSTSLRSVGPWTASSSLDAGSGSIGRYLRSIREARGMSVEEVSRATRIPIVSIERIEGDHFDDLPGEVFVRGFLKAYARAVQASVDEVLARYTACRRVAWVTPLPLSSASESRSPGRRVGVAIAFVLLLILFTVAISIVLKPRGQGVPRELSQSSAAAATRLG
ncbi:MAG: helix-turn-helix domain-containing protein [Myxococcales bacterium]|nr:helix-turn-helix domain-containing protein [Myxococcales bacterium]